jgi:RNA polymerase sigma-70 factor (ECF subfamily)
MPSENRSSVALDLNFLELSHLLSGNTVERHMREPDHTSDHELVERFRGGDRDAFAALYRAHFGGVFRFALYMTGDRGRAGELTQDVFVWLVHHPGEFDPQRGGLGPFLAGVARKFFHRLERREQRWLPLAEAAALSRDSDLVAGLEREQEAARLRRTIAGLPEAYREAVVLCDLEGMSYEEAAAVMECAVGTVRSRLHRGRELLGRKFRTEKEGQRCL